MDTLLLAFLKKKKVQQVLNTRPGEQGFSLVELVIVIAVLAILSAIAIPAFQGVQSQAKMSAVKNGLVNGVKECVVSAAVNVGSATATKYAVSQAFAGEYAGYTVMKLNNEDTCYKAVAISDDPAITNFVISYDPNTGVSTKTCDAKTGCTDFKW